MVAAQNNDEWAEQEICGAVQGQMAHGRVMLPDTALFLSDFLF